MRLLYPLATVIEQFDESLKIHQVFELITHAPPLSSHDDILACFVLAGFDGVFLEVVDVEDIEVIQQFIELGKNRCEYLYA
jgi:hypothetical protein